MSPTEIEQYLKRFAGMDDVLERVDRETSERPNAMMQSRSDQGALLTLLTRMLDAREALEVGTFTGYGAVCIARGLAPGGKLTCLEVDAEIAEVARRNLEAAGLSDRAEVKVGPAAEALEAIPAIPHIDFVYVDADKDGYPGYYEQIVPRLRPGGLVVLDNTLLGGRVLDAENERGRMMTALNERVAADVRVESVLLGLNDGMTLARKRVSGSSAGSRSAARGRGGRCPRCASGCSRATRRPGSGPGGRCRGCRRSRRRASRSASPSGRSCPARSGRRTRSRSA